MNGREVTIAGQNILEERGESRWLKNTSLIGRVHGAETYGQVSTLKPFYAELINGGEETEWEEKVA